MITVKLNERGVQGIRLPERLTSERLLRQREFLDRVAEPLRKLDEAIKAVDSSKQ